MSEETELPTQSIQSRPAEIGPAETVRKPCPACAEARCAGALFCPQCGRPLTAPLEPAPTSQATPAEVPSAATEHREEAIPDPRTQPASEQRLVPLVGPNAPSAVELRAIPLSCNCGRVLPDDARFCHRCGVRVGDAPPEQQLARIGSKHKHQSVTLTAGELVIGKEPDCGLIIGDDTYVSRRHARLFRSDGMLFLEDLGSANGTFLRVRRPIVLEPGDEIVVGTSVLRLDEVAC